jgi:CO dehydrogenase maturation factor
VGKTTIAAALIKMWAGEGHTVYAVDADPDASLASAIGIPDEDAARLKPVVEMRDLIREKSGDGAFYRLNPDLDEDLQDYCYQQGRILFLRMGGQKKGGSECYCRENTFLAALMSTLLLRKGDIVVMDMGAGIEHLSRGTSRGVDIMLVVVEPGKNSINTALMVRRMAGELGIGKVRFVANKIRSDKEREFVARHFAPGEVLAYIGFDDQVWESSMGEDSTLPRPGGEVEGAVREISRQLVKEVREGTVDSGS